MLKNFTLLNKIRTTRSLKVLISLRYLSFFEFFTSFAFTHFDTMLKRYLLKIVKLNDTFKKFKLFFSIELIIVVQVVVKRYAKVLVVNCP